MIRVLVVDDSAFMRQLFTKTIDQDPQLEVISTARDGADALDKIKKYNPDVLSMDIEMPIKNGLESLKEIAQMDDPVPVVMVSSQDTRDTVMTALELGAFDFIPKPSGSISLNIDDITEELKEKLKAAAKSRKINYTRPSQEPTINPVKNNFKKSSNNKFPVLAIGSSSGGPKALKKVLSTLPKNFPAATIIVQHMPAGFTTSLAKRLDDNSAISIKEAEKGDKLRPGHALLAPGDYHLEVDQQGTIKLDQRPKNWGVRPCVDYMMNSVATLYEDRVIGLILTGMGHDGAQGMQAIKKNGGYGFVEDESTALVYGMPGSVIKADAYDKIVPVHKAAQEIVSYIERSY